MKKIKGKKSNTYSQLFLIFIGVINCSHPESGKELTNSFEATNDHLLNKEISNKTDSESLSKDEPKILNSPEQEIYNAQQALHLASIKLNALRNINKNNSLKPDKITAHRSYLNAEKLFLEKQWLGVIRETNYYLNKTQIPEKKTYLRSQYLLAKSYEELKNNRNAARAYIRYIAGSLDSSLEDSPDLEKVVERAIIASANRSDSDNDLNTLLASIASTDLPPPLKSKVYYFAAKTALSKKNTQQARDWIEKANDAAPSGLFKNKIQYLMGMLLLHDKKWETSEDLFLEIAKDTEDTTTRDLARLALARISIHNKKPELALTHYQYIPEDSPSFKEALFESIYVHISKNDYINAKSKSLLFLARYPDTNESLQIRSIIAYLDMKSGNLDYSSQSLETEEDKIKEIKEWVKTTFFNKTSINHQSIKKFIFLSDKTFEPIPSLKYANKIFSKINEIKRRLNDTRGEIQNLFYAISHADLDTLKPMWRQREIQLTTIAMDVLTIGHRLVASERLLYQQEIDPINLQKLLASENRRTNLQASYKKRYPDKSHRRDIYQILAMSNQIAEIHSRIRSSDAEISALRTLAMQYKKDKQDDDKLLKNLEKRRIELDLKLNNAKRNVEQKKIDLLTSIAPFDSNQKLISNYSMMLLDEAGILENIREKSEEINAQTTAKHASSTWKIWKATMREVTSQMNNLQNEVIQSVRSMIQTIEEKEKDYKTIFLRLESINTELETKMASRAPYFIAQYENLIENRSSQHMKLRGDLEWLRYQNLVEKEEFSAKKRDLEQQILRDNLYDLQQGVRLKWHD